MGDDHITSRPRTTADGSLQRDEACDVVFFEQQLGDGESIPDHAEAGTPARIEQIARMLSAMSAPRTRPAIVTTPTPSAASMKYGRIIRRGF